MRVVLVTLDTLRYDALAGEAESPMPRMARRGLRATRFTRFFAASSSTQPTHATLFTGLHPWEHGVTRNGVVLDERFETVAERLARAGFETRAVTGSYPVAAAFGFGQGFDHYHEDPTKGFAGPVRAWEGHTLPSSHFFCRADEVTDRALAALDAATRSRQFFWFHYFDSHAPYGSSAGGELMEADVVARIQGGAPRRAVLDEVRALYRADAAFLDLHLERLFARIDAEADRFETHVVLVSDHGESLGEGGVLGHGTRLEPVQTHVPALIWSPRLAEGERQDVASSIDLASTLLSLSGMPPLMPGGRDLTATPESRGVAVGMRRTFRDDRAGEQRLDGRVHAIPPLPPSLHEEDGRHYVGNARRVRGPAEGRQVVQERFRAYERAYAQLARAPQITPDVHERLSALGYAP